LLFIVPLFSVFIYAASKLYPFCLFYQDALEPEVAFLCTSLSWWKHRTERWCLSRVACRVALQPERRYFRPFYVSIHSFT